MKKQVSRILEWTKNNANTILIVIVLLLLIGKNSPAPYTRGNKYLLAAQKSNPYVDGGNVEQSVYMSFSVADANSSFSMAEKAIEQFHGVVLSSSISKDSWQIEARIPKNLSKEFERSLEIGKIEHYTEYGRDISPQVSYNSEETKRLLKLKARLESLLERSNSTDEMIKLNTQISSIERQLSSLEMDRKRMEARLEYVKYTISATREKKPWEGVFSSIREYARTFLVSLNAGLLFVIKWAGYLVVPGLLGAITLLFLR